MYVIRVVHLITKLADIKKLYRDTIICLSDVLFRLEKFFLLHLEFWQLENDSEQLTFRSFLSSFFQGPHGVTDPTRPTHKVGTCRD